MSSAMPSTDPMAPAKRVYLVRAKIQRNVSRYVTAESSYQAMNLFCDQFVRDRGESLADLSAEETNVRLQDE